MTGLNILMLRTETVQGAPKGSILILEIIHGKTWLKRLRVKKMTEDYEHELGRHLCTGGYNYLGYNKILDNCVLDG